MAEWNRDFTGAKPFGTLRLVARFIYAPISVILVLWFCLTLFQMASPRYFGGSSGAGATGPGTPVQFAPGLANNVANCVEALDDLARDSTIYFPISTAEISSQDQKIVLALSEQLAKCPEAEIYVHGHADSTGSDAVNLEISWERAEAVVIFLASQDRETEWFRLHGQGAYESVFEGDSLDAEAWVNRRVTFRALAKEKPRSQ